MHLGITPSECRSAFAAGDMNYFNSSGCVETLQNDQLIDDTRKSINMKTYIWIGAGVLATALIVILATKRNKK